MLFSLFTLCYLNLIVTILNYIFASVLEETRKETPRLVFKDQNLDSARNLLRQSLRRRLRSMDRADGRRSMKARSLQRQCMLEASTVSSRQRNKQSTRAQTLAPPVRPTRPAPAPPKKKHITSKTISSFAGIDDLGSSVSTTSTTIDLNDSLRGPNVMFESTSLIKVQKTEHQLKPKLPPKPTYLQHVVKKHPSNSISEQSPPVPSHKHLLNSNIADSSDSIPMRNLHPSTNDIDSFSDDEEDKVR